MLKVLYFQEKFHPLILDKIFIKAKLNNEKTSCEILKELRIFMENFAVQFKIQINSTRANNMPFLPDFFQK